MSKFVTGTSHKSRKVALIFCLFGGFMGFHNFYVGKYGRGFFYMFTVGGFLLGWWGDIFKILVGDFTDRQGMPLVEW